MTIAGGGVHSILTTYGAEGEGDMAGAMKDVQTYRPQLTLEDTPTLRTIKEFLDHRIVTSIVSVFPSSAAPYRKFPGIPACPAQDERRFRDG